MDDGTPRGEMVGFGATWKERRRCGGGGFYSRGSDHRMEGNERIQVGAISAIMETNYV